MTCSRRPRHPGYDRHRAQQQQGTSRPIRRALAPFDHAIAYVPSMDLYLDGTAAEWTRSSEAPVDGPGAPSPFQSTKGTPKPACTCPARPRARASCEEGRRDDPARRAARRSTGRPDVTRASRPPSDGARAATPKRRASNRSGGPRRRVPRGSSSMAARRERSQESGATGDDARSAPWSPNSPTRGGAERARGAGGATWCAGLRRSRRAGGLHSPLRPKSTGRRLRPSSSPRTQKVLKRLPTNGDVQSAYGRFHARRRKRRRRGCHVTSTLTVTRMRIPAAEYGAFRPHGAARRRSGARATPRHRGRQERRYVMRARHWLGAAGVTRSPRRSASQGAAGRCPETPARRSSRRCATARPCRVVRQGRSQALAARRCSSPRAATQRKGRRGAKRLAELGAVGAKHARMYASLARGVDSRYCSAPFVAAGAYVDVLVAARAERRRLLVARRLVRGPPHSSGCAPRSVGCTKERRATDRRR